MKICQLTSSHPRNDTRVFLKECFFLAKAGYEVILIVADGKGDEIKNSVNIIDVGKENSRKNQLLKAPRKVYKKALEIDADIYHFHDPELIFIANMLRKMGKKVIYDVHEDVPRALLTRKWLPKLIMIAIAKIFEFVENQIAGKLIAIVTATPHISLRFKKINKSTITINNFPIINELQITNQTQKKQNEICYIGGIDRIRGIIQVLDALALTNNVTLNLAGNFENSDLENAAKRHKAWEKVNYYGFVNRSEAAEIMARSKAGLVTFLPAPNHIHARPNKMFEYMSAGLPVIGSNFNDWKEIIDNYGVGITVDPEKPNEIAKAIEKICNNENLVAEMGQNGEKAITEVFNWEKEAIKLIELYRKIN